jgi:hypothetical protein
VRDVLVAGEYDVDGGVLEKGENVTSVPDDVALSSCSGDGDQMVMEDEYAEVGRFGELLSDPVISLPPDLTLGQVGLGAIDTHQRQALGIGGALHMDYPVAFRTRIALAEMVLEVQVADVLGVVVARNDHGGEPLLQRPQCITGGEELGGVPLLGEVSGDDDEVRGQLLDLSDRVRQELGIEER